MNIIKDLGGLVTDQLVKQAASSLGESESGISSAIGSLVPTILGGMLNKTNDTAGFGQIFDMISSKENAGFLDNLGGLVGGGNLAQGDPKDIAGGLMGSLFGNKVGGILDLVGSLAGVKRSSSSGLLGMVAPMIMGYLGKKVLGGGLNASGLLDMLTGQRQNITSAMPQGIADMIGFDMGDSMMDKATGAMGDAASTAKGAAGKVVGTAGDTAKAAASAVGGVAGKTADVAGDVVNSGGNMLMKILPIVGLLAVALIGWKMCGNEVPTNPIEKVGDATGALVDAAGDAATAVGDVASDAAGAVGDVASDAAGAVGDAAGAVGDAMGGLGGFFKTKLSSGVELNIPEMGVENKLIKFLNSNTGVSMDQWYNFDRILFATGSATIDRGKSTEQINNITEILKAYEGVEIKIGGYTDNTGNPESNMRLSAARAQAVKNALVAGGINGARIATEGFGIAHPVATNDTPEGRALNRRIAVNVTKK